ncbi:MAG: hypothetical protein BWY66_02712 [bacterium ADurb.Bin374]|nr:MAG: hypothetical protein BWY66_02712 [bacterium ADurb.Bin374]
MNASRRAGVGAAFSSARENSPASSLQTAAGYTMTRGNMREAGGMSASGMKPFVSVNIQLQVRVFPTGSAISLNWGRLSPFQFSRTFLSGYPSGKRTVSSSCSVGSRSPYMSSISMGLSVVGGWADNFQATSITLPRSTFFRPNFSLRSLSYSGVELKIPSSETVSSVR